MRCSRTTRAVRTWTSSPGVGVVSLGHCHPARRRCARGSRRSKLIHVSNYYYIEGRGEVARRLVRPAQPRAPPRSAEPWQSFFANSGAEANECAIKLARLHARKRAEAQARAAASAAPRVVVTLDRSFHGRTHGHAGRHGPARQAGGVPAPARRLRPHGATTTWPRSRPCSPSGASEICAVMVECVQGESGVHPCTPEFLHAVRRLTERARRAAHLRRDPDAACTAAARIRSGSSTSASCPTS